MGKLTESRRLGRYFDIRLAKNFVSKRLAPVAEFERRVVDSTPQLQRQPEQERYQSELSRANIRFAPLLMVNSDLFLQRRARGLSLKALLARLSRTHASVSDFSRDAFRPLRVLAGWLDRLEYHSPHVMIDTGLENLIVTRRGLTLIDVFPPIDTRRFPAPRSRRERVITELFTSPPTQAAALVYYWFRAVARRIVNDQNVSQLQPLADAVTKCQTILASALSRPPRPDTGNDAFDFFSGASKALVSCTEPALWLKRIDQMYLRNSFLKYVERADSVVATESE